MSAALMLDLFCKAGGATKGYQLAGFHVTGVDIEPQPNYCGDGFVQGDAIELMERLLAGATVGGHRLDDFTAVHASPPCKVHTSLKPFSGSSHTDLIPETRELLERSGLPYVIENVPGSPLRADAVLCGSMFDLGVRRHRLFESNVALVVPECRHREQEAASPMYPVRQYHSGRPVVHMSPVIGVYGRGQGLGPGEADLWRRAMGTPWMVKDEMAQAIPPAYTEHVGRQLMAALSVEAAR